MSKILQSRAFHEDIDSFDHADQTSSVCEMPLTHGIHDHHGGQSELSRNSGALLSDETVSTQEIKSNTAKIPSIRLLVRELKVTLSIKIS